MRKRRWAFGLALTLAVVVVVILIAARKPRGPDFAFLEGHKPFLVYSHPEFGVNTYYSFRADPTSMKEATKKELEPMGFDTVAAEAGIDLKFRTNDVTIELILNTRFIDLVWSQYRDLKGRGVQLVAARGWVAIAVHVNSAPPTLLQRIRSFLGL